MKNLVAVLALVTFVVGCTEDRVTVFHNNDRVTELERRANLNDQLNALQNQRLDALEAALALETEARQEGDLNLSQDIADLDEELRDLLAQEEAARIAGDDTLRVDLQVEIANRVAGDQANSAALAVSVFAQSLVNVAVQVQLNQLNSKISQANTKISTLTTRVNNLESDLDDLEAEVAQLAADMAGINTSLQAQIDLLSVQQAATQAQLNQQGVQLFKCNSSSSTERLMKINGKFYAVMNRVKTEQVQVITGSSSVTFSTPLLCTSGGGSNLSLGPCDSGKTPVPNTGTTVTVPSYSTVVRTVVTEVKIALDILTDGGYVTTDGGTACNFSISSGGTVATNLIPVQ